MRQGKLYAQGWVRPGTENEVQGKKSKEEEQMEEN